MSDHLWKPGQSGNPSGRKKGIVDKRQRLQQTIRDGIDSVIAMLQAKAAEGDVQAAALLLSRGIAPLRAESDDRVEFEFDSSKPVADQIVQVAAAVSRGELSLGQGTRFAEILQRIAAVRALNQGGDSEEAKIQAMRDMAAALTASGRV